MDEWRSEALCLGLAPQNVTTEHCQDCAVRHDCLWEALSWADWYRTDSYYASLVWGGFHGATRNKAMYAADFKIRVAYEDLLAREREKKGTQDKSRE